MNMILKTLVGSRAHGLHNDDSDYDYRGVFVQSTSELLSLNNKVRTTNWIEGKEDNTSYELSHFLSLACRSNPAVLEVLVSPVIEETQEGRELRELFPYVWNSRDVFNSFYGYSHNQKKKFVDNKDDRAKKYAVAAIRNMRLGIELLQNGTMTVLVGCSDLRRFLLAIRAGEVTYGFILDHILMCEEDLKSAYNKNKHKMTDFDKVNEFLLNVRRNNLLMEDLLT
jgi:hypothetical protein